MGGLDFHSYGMLILSQPGWTRRGSLDDTVPTEKYTEMIELGDSMATAIRQQTGTSISQIPNRVLEHKNRGTLPLVGFSG